MPLFRRHHRPSPDDEARQRSRAAHPSVIARQLGGQGHASPYGWTPAFDESDWAQISAFLEEVVPVRVPERSVSVVALAAALERLRASVGSSLQAKGPVVDQLLDIWVIANDIDREVARPAERLLFALVDRDLVGASEVNAACVQIHGAASLYGI